MAKSLVDLAFDFVESKGKACSFEEIWVFVCEQNGVDVNDMSKKSNFYSNLSIDGRLFNVGNNEWNLASLQTADAKKERYKYDNLLDTSESSDEDLDDGDREEVHDFDEEHEEEHDEEGEPQPSEEEYE